MSEQREGDGWRQFTNGEEVLVAWRDPLTTQVIRRVKAQVVFSPSEMWRTWDAIDVKILDGPLPENGFVGRGDTVPVPSNIVEKLN